MAATQLATMAAPCPLLGDGLTDDTLLNIVRFLPTARDLVCLQLTCPRFAAKVIAAAPSVGGEDAAAAALEMLCIPEEAGRLWLAECSEQERGWVPRRELESLLGLMQEVAALRVPLAFGRAHHTIMLSEGGAVATRSVQDSTFRVAASTAVMRSGRHYARFTVGTGSMVYFGVIRPGWDVEGGEFPHWVDGHCFYGARTAERFPGTHEWEGMQPAAEQGDHIGMLLDLGQGSMTVWKNDEKLGVMQAEGLSGPFCWAVSLVYTRGYSARIESAPAPASPTEEEMVEARARDHAAAVAVAEAEAWGAAGEDGPGEDWPPDGY